jgi:hypothetical protein
MNPIFKHFEDIAIKYLEADRAYREAKAAFTLKFFDSAFRPKAPTVVELTALVEGNTELNELKMTADKLEYALKLAKADLDHWTHSYDTEYRTKEN